VRRLPPLVEEMGLLKWWRGWQLIVHDVSLAGRKNDAPRPVGGEAAQAPTGEARSIRMYGM
jgi:hypothetical protein